MIYILRWLNSGLPQEIWKSPRCVFKKHSWWQAWKPQWGWSWSGWGKGGGWPDDRVCTECCGRFSNMAASGLNHNKKKDVGKRVRMDWSGLKCQNCQSKGIWVLFGHWDSRPGAKKVKFSGWGLPEVWCGPYPTPVGQLKFTHQWFNASWVQGSNWALWVHWEAMGPPATSSFPS